MSSEDFMGILKQTEVDMVRMREHAWKEMSQKIESVLSDSGYPSDSLEREALKLSLKNAWMIGYNNGALDTAAYMTKAILTGKGKTDPLSSLANNQLKQRPENN